MIEQAYRMGVQPDRLAQEITEHGQIGSVVADVLRGKALNLITERVTVTDEAGKPVDVSAALRPDTDGAEAEAEAGAQDAVAGDAAAESEPELESEPERRSPRPRREPSRRPTQTRTKRPLSSNGWRAACADSEQAAGRDVPAPAGRYRRNQ